MTSGPVRRATHAGSWYSEDTRQLDGELSGWLGAVGAPQPGPAARAIIGPHAGYRYCGANAAHAYRQIDPTGVKRVFILGPSHRLRLDGCAISGCSRYETPLYDLQIDTALNEQLMDTGEFDVMSIQSDEDEHSIEMHLSYVAKVMESRRNNFLIVPILVGSLSPENEAKYGQIFAPYMKDPSNIFVISSDFCHWGQRFRYTHYDESCGEIWESIKSLDYMGMNIIEALDHSAFSSYLRKYGNTICGRHPIGVFLGMVTALRREGAVPMKCKFLDYDQSSKCKRMADSSVSYAAASFSMGS